MQRLSLTFLAAALALAAAAARAQGGDLAGVTMRVLDDVSDVDAVVLELDSSRAEDEDGAGRSSGASSDEPAADGEPVDISAAGVEEDRFDDPSEAELHDSDVDERSESRLEDRDVERPAVAAPAP
jgi:hypothetical protein